MSNDYDLFEKACKVAKINGEKMKNDPDCVREVANFLVRVAKKYGISNVHEKNVESLASEKMYVDISREMLNGTSDLGAAGTEIEQSIIDSIQQVLDTDPEPEPERVVQVSKEPESISEEEEEWDPCVKMNGETVNYTEFLDKDGRPFVVSRLPNGGFFFLDANRFRNELDACGVRYNIAQNQELLEEHFEFPTPRGLTEEEEILCKQIEKIRLAEEKKKKEEEAKTLGMAEKKREKNRKKREKQKEKKKRDIL